jgi:hypothetical protein
MTLDELHDLLSGHRYTYSSELLLQAGIASVLVGARVPFIREAELPPKRIDFLVGDIGVEVKIKGSNSDVLRQLHGYATFPQVKSLLLVTTLPRHELPATLLGKPCRVLRLGGVG